MTQEAKNDREKLRGRFNDLAATIDEETEFLSGGYDRHEDFSKVVDMGEQAIPFMLTDIAEFEGDDDMCNPWWRIQAINTILHTQGKPVIYYSPEVSGRLQAVIEVTLKWGADASYIQETT